MDTAMAHKTLAGLTVIVALLAFGAGTAIAGPMMCSGEEKNCVAVCQKNPPALAVDCINTCRDRFNYCRHTGCWDSGTSRYCRLLRK
jgi:hypothetical protein